MRAILSLLARCPGVVEAASCASWARQASFAASLSFADLDLCIQTWHLYYQYNPNSTVAGNQHWGHSTSPDLLTWTNEPIALAPERAGEGIFSGSAVIDVNNTSGLFGEDTNPNSRIVLM